MDSVSLPPSIRIPGFDSSPASINDLDKVEGHPIVLKDYFDKTDRYVLVRQCKTGKIFKFAKLLSTKEESLICSKCVKNIRSAVRCCGIGTCHKVVCQDCLVLRLRDQTTCEFCLKTLIHCSTIDETYFQPDWRDFEEKTSITSAMSMESLQNNESEQQRGKILQDSNHLARYDSYHRNCRQLLRPSVFADFTNIDDEDVETVFDLTTETQRKVSADKCPYRIDLKNLLTISFSIGIKMLSLL